MSSEKVRCKMSVMIRRDCWCWLGPVLSLVVDDIRRNCTLVFFFLFCRTLRDGGTNVSQILGTSQKDA